MCAISRITRGSACGTSTSAAHSSGTSWKPSLRAASAGNSDVRSGVAVNTTLITSSVNVFYRDVSPVVQIAMQLWLYVTPVVYPLARLKPQWRFWISLNPLTGIVEAFHSSLVYGRAPDWQVLGISATFTIVVFVGAFILFKNLDRYFADVI